MTRRVGKTKKNKKQKGFFHQTWILEAKETLPCRREIALPVHTWFSMGVDVKGEKTQGAHVIKPCQNKVADIGLHVDKSLWWHLRWCSAVSANLYSYMFPVTWTTPENYVAKKSLFFFSTQNTNSNSNGKCCQVFQTYSGFTLEL